MATRTRRPRKVAESVIPKDQLAAAIARILDEQDLTQTEAAHRMKDSPSQISLVVTGKTHGFSAERLLRMLLRLGRDVNIEIRKSRGGNTGRVRLVIR